MALTRQVLQRTISYWPHLGHLKVTLPGSLTIFFLQELHIFPSIFELEQMVIYKLLLWICLYPKPSLP